MSSRRGPSSSEHPTYQPRVSRGGRWRGQNASPQPVSRLPRDPEPQRSRHDFELIASVSRSSGLDKDGDALKEPQTQEGYKEFIQGKIAKHWKRYPVWERNRNSNLDRSRKEGEENLLIQLRKLREGISASKRCDRFAIEVNEISLHLSILFNSTIQFTSVASHLPELYRSAGVLTPPWTAVLILLYILCINAPSQKAFYDKRKSLHYLHSSDPLSNWLSCLARALHRRDFSNFEALSHLESIRPLLPASRPPSSSTHPDLPVEALKALLERLRTQARLTSWRVLRSAYRGELGPQSRAWLGRQLLCDTKTTLGLGELDNWLSTCEREGDLVRKDGVEDRWVIPMRR